MPDTPTPERQRQTLANLLELVGRHDPMWRMWSRDIFPLIQDDELEGWIITLECNLRAHMRTELEMVRPSVFDDIAQHEKEHPVATDD